MSLKKPKHINNKKLSPYDDNGIGWLLLFIIVTVSLLFVVMFKT